MEENEKIKTPKVYIKKIEFNNEENAPLELKHDDIVVFVGPNNVGKSRILKDLRNYIIKDPISNKIIVKNVEYEEENFNKENMEAYFLRNFPQTEFGRYSVNIGYTGQIYTYGEHEFGEISKGGGFFYKTLFSFLSTEERLNMTAPIYLANIQQNKVSFNIMKKLEKDEEAIKRLNKVLNSCFGKGVDITETEYQNSLYKVYKFGEEDEINEIIKSNTRNAISKLETLEDLSEQGDGIRSAVAILSSLIAEEHSIYFMDEPETFLHPPQARVLGNNIVELSEGKQCFISTHNIDLIKGILEKKSNRVKIVKIDRDGDKNKIDQLKSESIEKISDDKNLKYSNILDGLFYKQVVLCENESDCKFYAAVLENVCQTTYQNTLFCGVGGKSQFKMVGPLLKDAKINYIVIADLDLIDDKERLKGLVDSIEENKYDEIKNDHSDFLTLFESKKKITKRKQLEIKKEIIEIFDASKSDEYMSEANAKKIKSLLKNVNSLSLLKEEGSKSVPEGDCKNKYKKILKTLESLNVYLVECGEIENFVPQIKGHGPKWVEEVFKKYPNMEEQEYNDVKDFIRKVFHIS